MSNRLGRKAIMPSVNIAAMLAARPPAVVGRVRAGANPDVGGVLQQISVEVDRIGNEQGKKIEELQARVRDTEQVLADRTRHGRNFGADETPGARFVASDAFRQFGGSAGRGAVSSVVQAITSGSTSAGPMITPDKRSEVIGLPRRRLTVRGLLAPGTTASNTVQFSRQTTRTNAAAVVTESAEKPESTYAWELIDAPVRTIAHWVPVSRQAMDDAPMLQSTIDGELRYGLQLAEESELLFGSGSGQHLNGVATQATAYETSRDSTGDTRFDTLAHALAQAQVALLPATGIVMNDDDLEALKIIKDDQGRYIGGGPFGPPITTIWGRPVVGTPVMTGGHFLVGAFLDGAQIFDRLDAEVLVSSEDRDNFIKNMLTVRAEERLALAVKRPTAFITGTFPT
jgi:HK97 family phage major capsid protein